MAPESEPKPIRLAEIVAALSLGIDLGFAQPMEHVLRQCLIALRIADGLGLDDQQRGAVYYTALLVNVGCHTDAHEQAKWFGDDFALKAGKYDGEPLGRPNLRAAVSGMRMIGFGHPPLHRFKLGVEFLLSGRREVDNMIAHHAAMARTLGEKLSLPKHVLDALGACYERWDGQGWPGTVAGEHIPIAARIAQIAEFSEVAHRLGGIPAVKKLAREWRGSFDPAITDCLTNDADRLFADLGEVAVWDAVIGSEPALADALVGEQLSRALIAVADFVDLKSPYFLGHARAVADLAGEAARRAGMRDAQVGLLRHAGLVHGFGRLGISNAILDKAGSLGAGEWERVRLQPYVTGRMLRQSAGFGPIARVVVQHRERVDGSGYPNGLTGASISPEARILAAADAYQSMCEPRPHRPARSADEAADILRSEVEAGRYDADAVGAVLSAAGHRIAQRRPGPAGLTLREVEILRLLARGLSNKQIAKALFISAKTVSNHVEHIYEKIEVSSRASASLFAMQHGLLPEHGFPASA